MKTRIGSLLWAVVISLFLSLSVSHLVQAQGGKPPRPLPDFNAVADDLAAGWSYYLQEDYPKAIDMFSKVIEAEPDWAEGYVGRGLAYDYQQDYEDSLTDLDKALSLDSNDGAMYFYRSYPLIGLGKYNLAIESLTQGIALSPNLDFTHYYQGLLYKALGQNDEALTSLTRAIELNPSDSGYFQSIADVYKLLGKTALSQLYGSISNGLKSIEVGQISSAIANFTRLLSDTRYSDYPVALSYIFYNRALEYIQLENPDAALADLDQAILLNPSFPQTYLARSDIYNQKHDPFRTSYDIDQVIKVAPDYPPGYLRRAAQQQRTGHRLNAAADYWQWITLNQTRDFTDGPYKPGRPFTIWMGIGGTYVIPMRVTAGQSVTITAQAATDRNGTYVVDPLILILDTEGVPLLANDNDGDSLDAAIRDYALPTTGLYKLIVSHAGGGSVGLIQVNITLAGSAP